MTTTPAPSAAEIDLLWHTLGLRPDQREGKRNHFVAGNGHHDMPGLESLERQGLMERRRSPAFLPEGDVVFAATAAGRADAIARLPEPPPPPKPCRYRDWLEADCNESFAEFLCRGQQPKFEVEVDHRGVNGHRRLPFRYRMYRRERWGYAREVQGEWAPTKRDAKASYKAALAAMKERARHA